MSSPADHRKGSVGAVFQLGAMLGVGRCGGIEKTSLISLTSEERWVRPHIKPEYLGGAESPSRPAGHEFPLLNGREYRQLSPTTPYNPRQEKWICFT
jgi:hypothetical protein